MYQTSAKPQTVARPAMITPAPVLRGSSTTRTWGWAACTASTEPSVDALSTTITGPSCRPRWATSSSRRLRVATTTVTRCWGSSGASIASSPLTSAAALSRARRRARPGGRALTS